MVKEILYLLKLVKRAQEVKLVDKFIRTYISDKTQVLPLNIIGGNSGFSLIADPGTKLSEIKLPGSLDIEFGKNGRTYIRVGKYSNKIQVFPEKTSSELAQNVAKLLADPKVTTAVKFGILEKIYNINDDNFNVTYDNTKKKPVMVIYSGKDEVYNSENPELTDEGFITDVLANVYVNISKENIDGSIQLPDYTGGKLVKRNTPYNNFITKNSKVFVALRNDGSIKYFNPSLQYEFTVEALEEMYPTEKKQEPVVSSTDTKIDAKADEEYLGTPEISKIEIGTINNIIINGDLYQFKTKDGLISGVMLSSTEFRIDGISANEVGKGQGSKMFESLISYLKSKGVTTLKTESAGEGAIKMHNKAFPRPHAQTIFPVLYKLKKPSIISNIYC